MTGIYRIKNMITGKCYIGKSEINIKKRWKEHIKALKKNQHYNNYLQNAWNKYGEENFIFGVIEEYPPEQCSKQERYWIAYYNSFKHGYNQTEGGEGCLGYKYTEEQKQKQSKIMKKIMKNPIVKQKISKTMKGKNAGEKHPMYGKHLSEETKQKQSKSLIGKNKGIQRYEMTEEIKQKMSESKKGEQNYQWIIITEEMKNDYIKGIKRKDFYNKYQDSEGIWKKLKRMKLR